MLGIAGMILTIFGGLGVLDKIDDPNVTLGRMVPFLVVFGSGVICLVLDRVLPGEDD